MRRKTALYALIVIGALLLLLKISGRFAPSTVPGGRFRETAPLILTRHAKCRMNCRHITEEEIREILKDGMINYGKSGVGAKGDSTFALEGYSRENQHLRVVVAPENDGLVIITCIDLGHQWPCDCQ